MDYEKYTKAQLARAVSLAKGSPANPRSRDEAWRQLNNICAGDLALRAHYLDQVAPQTLPEEESQLTWVNELRDLHAAVDGVADDIGTVSDDGWIGMHVFLQDHALDTYEGWKPVHIGPHPFVIDDPLKTADDDSWIGESPAEKKARVRRKRRAGVEAKVVEMLHAGCTAREVSAAVGWQLHTFRGFVSEGARIRYGLVIDREKVGKGKGSETRYVVREDVREDCDIVEAELMPDSFDEPDKPVF